MMRICMKRVLYAFLCTILSMQAAQAPRALGSYVVDAGAFLYQLTNDWYDGNYPCIAVNKDGTTAKPNQKAYLDLVNTFLPVIPPLMHQLKMYQEVYQNLALGVEKTLTTFRNEIDNPTSALGSQMPPAMQQNLSSALQNIQKALEAFANTQGNGFLQKLGAAMSKNVLVQKPESLVQAFQTNIAALKKAVDYQRSSINCCWNLTDVTYNLPHRLWCLGMRMNSTGSSFPACQPYYGMTGSVSGCSGSAPLDDQLIVAVQEGNRAQVEAFLSLSPDAEQAANATDRSYGQNTALANAAARGFIDIMQVLIKAGAEPLKKGLVSGKSACDWALQAPGGMQGVQKVLETLGTATCAAQIEQFCSELVNNASLQTQAESLVNLRRLGDFCTSQKAALQAAIAENPQLDQELILAVQSNNEAAVQQLLSLGASSNAVDESPQQNTALMNAAARNNVAIANLLINNGADKSKKNNSGGTACDWAKISGPQVEALVCPA